MCEHFNFISSCSGNVVLHQKQIGNNWHRNSLIEQFRYVKIQSKTIDLSMRLWGITTEFVGFIPQSLMLRSIVLNISKLVYFKVVCLQCGVQQRSVKHWNLIILKTMRCLLFLHFVQYYFY